MADGDHYVVRVEVKEVRVPRPVEDSKGYAAKMVGGGTLLTERSVVDRLSVTVSAADEQEAVTRAINMLRAQSDGPRDMGHVQV